MWLILGEGVGGGHYEGGVNIGFTVSTHLLWDSYFLMNVVFKVLLCNRPQLHTRGRE